MAHRTAAELEEERLEILAAQRDRAAFATIYERYVYQIHAYVYTLTHDMEQADDVTAATFTKAIEELPRFQWRGVPSSAWLYRVAGNLVSRDRRRPGWIELEPRMLHDAGADPGDQVEADARAYEVRAAVAELPHDQRQAILLRFGGELRNREIAEIMDRSEGAVKLLSFRALTALRRKLGAQLPAERLSGSGSWPRKTFSRLPWRAIWLLSGRPRTSATCSRPAPKSVARWALGTSIRHIGGGL